MDSHPIYYMGTHYSFWVHSAYELYVAKTARLGRKKVRRRAPSNAKTRGPRPQSTTTTGPSTQAPDGAGQAASSKDSKESPIDPKDPRYAPEMCRQFKRTLCYRNVSVHFVGVWVHRNPVHRPKRFRALRRSRSHRWRKDKVQLSLELSVCSAASSKLSPPCNQELRSNVTGPRTWEVCYTAKIAEAESIEELVGEGGSQSIRPTFMGLTSSVTHRPPQLRMCLVEGAQRRNEESGKLQLSLGHAVAVR